MQNGKIMDLKEKAEHLNNFFTKQCEFPSVLTTKTCKSLSVVEFSTNDILKLIRNLNPDKTHGHDSYSKSYDKYSSVENL